MLSAGIPTIIKPFFGDQFFWADRVEALGVGSGVRKLTVESLTDALRAATTDIKQIDRAKLVGEQIRAVCMIYEKLRASVLMNIAGKWTCHRNGSHISRSRICEVFDQTRCS